MAIRNRNGLYDKFVPDKLVPGEFAFVRGGDPNSKDGMSIYASFAAGRTKRLATYEDMVENIRIATEDATGEIVQDVAAELIAATNRANTAATDAEQNAIRAESAAKEAEVAISGAKTPVFKSVSGFPAVGDSARIYIDDTVSPRLLYTWSSKDGYVLTGGAGSGGGDGLAIIAYTYADYQALPESEKMRDDVIYDITDREGGVTFGNDDISGIGDGTVTGAVVALDSNFNNNTLITPSSNSRFTLVSGGYINIGKFVLVQVVVKCNVTASNSPSTLTIDEIKHDSALSCIDITNQISNSITASVPCGVSSNGTVYIKETVENHTYAITGMLLR